MTQLTLVTGNNQKNTINEFKSPDYPGLKSSLCTLYLNPTKQFLFYGIAYNGVFHYLKKIHWETDYETIIKNEFDANSSFMEVLSLSFEEDTTLIPNSFTGTNKKKLNHYMPGANKKNTHTTALNATVHSIYTEQTEWLSAILKIFPESKVTNSFSPFINTPVKTEYKVIVNTSIQKTQLVLLRNNSILLCEQYTTPNETESLYFILNVLKVNNIEDQSRCTLLLCCESNEQKMNSTVSEYFENIILPSDNVNIHGFPLSKQDKIDYLYILSAQ